MIRPLPCPRRAPVAALCLLAASAAGCRRTPAVEKERPAAAVPVIEATVAPTPSASAATPGTIPAFTAEKFAPGGEHPDAVYAVEGGIAVTSGPRVGLVAGETITWVGSVPKETPALGPNQITSVRGRAPDMLAAIYVSGNGRAPQPTYVPLTGKGGSLVVAPGGGWGNINGVARVGETVFLATDSAGEGAKIVPVRGPKLVRHLHTPAEAGCKPGEVGRLDMVPDMPAIIPAVLESSPAGTMVSLGNLCEKRGPVAEIWDRDGKSKIVDLGRWWKKSGYWPRLLKGEGDELWAFGAGWTSVVLHYRDGVIEALPELGRRIEAFFVSPRGQLHVSDGKVIHRYEGGQWVPVGVLPADLMIQGLALDEQGTFWVSGPGVYRLRPGPGVPPPGECATPFVYLYDASYKNGKRYTYPATRKALATFPEASSLGLVEFGAEYSRAVGVTVESRAQAQALIAHLASAMKDEDPHYFCYEPKDVRKIALDARE